MKRVVASFNSDQFLEDVKLIDQELRELFKDRSLESITYEKTAGSGLISQYVVSRKLSGRGIEIYKKIVDDSRTGSFGGGVTLCSGYWDVAQRVRSIEPDLSKWSASHM